jgi:hypothetical protein
LLQLLVDRRVRLLLLRLCRRVRPLHLRRRRGAHLVQARLGRGARLPRLRLGRGACLLGTATAAAFLEGKPLGLFATCLLCLEPRGRLRSQLVCRAQMRDKFRVTVIFAVEACNNVPPVAQSGKCRAPHSAREYADYLVGPEHEL